MTTINMNHVQFWQAPLEPSSRRNMHQHNRSASATNRAVPTFKRSYQSNSVVAPARGHDPTTQPEFDRVGTQGRTYGPNSEADDDLPSIEEIIYPLLRKEILAENRTLQYPEEWTLNTNESHHSLLQAGLADSVDSSQGTRDKPVILEDEADSPDPDTTSIPASVNNGAERFVNENLCPLPPLDNDSELKRDLQLAFEEQEKSSSTTTPGSPQPRRCSIEPSHLRIDQGHGQGGTGQEIFEEIGYSSLLQNQDHGEEEQEVEMDLLGEEAAAEEEEEEEDDNNENEQQEKRGEKRRHQDEAEETSSGDNDPESSDDSHDTNGQDNEDLRPAKQQKLALVSTQNPTPPPEHSPTPRLRRSPNYTPSSTTQPNDTQSQTNQRHPPILIDGHQHHSARTTRSPSVTTGTPLVAEYQEWPIPSFLKRTRIGNDTTYHLEFKLPCISLLLNLPTPPEALGAGPSTGASANATISDNAVTHSKVYPAAVRRQNKRVKWTLEEEATILEMREDSYSWKDIHAALPRRSSQAIQVRYCTKLKRKPQQK